MIRAAGNSHSSHMMGFYLLVEKTLRNCGHVDKIKLCLILDQ